MSEVLWWGKGIGQAYGFGDQSEDDVAVKALGLSHRVNLLNLDIWIGHARDVDLALALDRDRASTLVLCLVVA